MKNQLAIILADNGVFLDWPDGRRIVYGDQREQLTDMLDELAKFIQGYYSDAFEKHSLSIQLRVRETYDGPEGISDTALNN